MINKGQKVICVDDDFRTDNDAKLDAIIKLFEHLPLKGKIYTVRDIYISPKGISITLNEIINPILTTEPFKGAEPNFRISRFKPLVEEEIEIEVFEEALN